MKKEQKIEDMDGAELFTEYIVLVKFIHRSEERDRPRLDVSRRERLYPMRDEIFRRLKEGHLPIKSHISEDKKHDILQPMTTGLTEGRDIITPTISEDITHCAICQDNKGHITRMCFPCLTKIQEGVKNG